MNTKKIWTLAIIFGLVMSISFLLLINPNDEINTAPDQNVPEVAVESEEETTVPDLLEIEMGKRAISLAVDEVQSVSGFVRPGSFVDVVSISGGERAQILLENIRVLAVGQTIMEDEEETEAYNMVTLELFPEEGAALSLAKEIGQVHLMLRNSEDQNAVPPVNLSIEQLIKGQMPK